MAGFERRLAIHHFFQPAVMGLIRPESHGLTRSWLLPSAMRHVAQEPVAVLRPMIWNGLNMLINRFVAGSGVLCDDSFH